MKNKSLKSNGLRKGETNLSEHEKNFTTLIATLIVNVTLRNAQSNKVQEIQLRRSKSA